MPLIEVTRIEKITVVVALELSTAKLVDQYAAFANAPADDVMNQALQYVFSKDKEFLQYRDQHGDAQVPASLRVKRPAPTRSGAKRGPKPCLAVAN